MLSRRRRFAADCDGIFGYRRYPPIFSEQDRSIGPFGLVNSATEAIGFVRYCALLNATQRRDRVY